MKTLSDIPGPWSIGADAADDGSISIYRVNTGLRHEGPGSHCSIAVRVTFEFEAIDNEGMPTSSASESLKGLEERINGVLSGTEDAVLVGLVTTPDMGRMFCFYTTDTHQLIDTLSGVTRPYQGKAKPVLSGEDTGWFIYGEILEHAMSGEADIHLVKRLHLRGVEPALERTVEHVLLFPSSEVAKSALAERLGAFSSRGPIELEGDDVWSVTIIARQSVQFAELADWRRHLKSVVADYGGSYDGWRTPVETGTGEVQWIGRSYRRRP